MDQPSAVDQARLWSSRSHTFLVAASSLEQHPGMRQPAMRLALLAVEYQLRGYFLAARGSAPTSADVTRLLDLARHCGLVLSPAQVEAVAQLAVAAEPASGNANDVEGSDERLNVARVEALCRAIGDQAPG